MALSGKLLRKATRRFRAWGIAVLFGLSSSAVCAYAAPGDVCGTAGVDLSDALCTLRYVVQLIPHDAANDAIYAAADVSPLDPVTRLPKGNTSVDIADALGILRHVVHLDGWVSAATSVSGTAATGAPIAAVTLTLVDAAGTSRATTTGADGSYTIDTTGLVPPFMVQVITGTGTKLYSVSADTATATTVNVTPLTDLIIRSWYGVQNGNVDTAFANPVSFPPPTPTTVQIIGNVVKNMMQLWLDQAGVAPTDFNLISTPFSADGTGVDQVLDRTAVDAGTGTITVTDTVTTQSSTVTAAGGSVTVSTTTSNANGTTESVTGTAVPVQTAQQTALDAIAAGLDSLAATINAKGVTLQASDFLPYLDPALLDEGKNQTQFATEAAAQFSQGQTASFSVLSIKSLDTVNNLADVVFSVSQSLNGQTQTETVEFFFKQVAGAWLLSGNQRIASVNLSAEMRTNQGAFAGDNGPDINVDVQAPVGTVTGVALTGAQWTNAPFTQNATEVTPIGNLDHYFFNSGPLPALIPAGTQFAVALTTPGGTVTYTLPSNVFTTEAISITNLTGTSAAPILGTSLPVAWTLPTTFPIARVKLDLQTYTGDQTNPGPNSFECQVDGPVLGTTATSGEIFIPSTCNGLPVLQVNVNLSVDGVNGEREQVIYFFN